jgi:hypothetical protein
MRARRTGLLVFLDLVVLVGVLSAASEVVLRSFGHRPLPVNISVHLTGANTNLPHDGHPSVRATRQYARRLVQFLLQQELAARQPAV